MNFLEQKNQIEQALQFCYQEQNKIVQSVQELFNYLDLEVYNVENEEDLHVTNLIQKKVDFFSQKIIEKIQNLLQESENIKFETSKDGLEIYEPIIYIYGSYIKEDKEKYKFKKSYIHSYLNDVDSFLLVVDLMNGYKIIPWKI